MYAPIICDHTVIGTAKVGRYADDYTLKTLWKSLGLESGHVSRDAGGE